MKDFNVLFTCCANHFKERADSLRENEDGVKVGIYAANCNPDNLPPDDLVEGNFIVPPITAPEYLDKILAICLGHGIDIIIPTATIELRMMAENKGFFERHGIKVSVASPEAISVLNDKMALQRVYGSLMPIQSTPKTIDDLADFYRLLPKDSGVCCKLSDHAGGNGFAIVDDEKATDITLFNKFGENTYISKATLAQIVLKNPGRIIVQEYVKGIDFSVSVLAWKGAVTHIVGYAGYQMSYGAIVNGEIRYNSRAYEIATKLTKEIGLDGNACFDFRIKDDGTVVLLEVNPRVNASLPFVWKAGVNMLYLRCKNLYGDYSDMYQYNNIKFGLKMKKYHGSRYFL